MSFFLVSLYQTYDIFIKTVEIVRKNWEVAYNFYSFYRVNEASIFDAKIQVNRLCFRQNMQAGRRRAKWKVLRY